MKDSWPPQRSKFVKKHDYHNHDDMLSRMSEIDCDDPTTWFRLRICSHKKNQDSRFKAFVSKGVGYSNT